MKLSILIPLYNGSEFLSRTLDSLVDKKFAKDIELVLCDDCSKDNTFLIAEKYSREYKNISLYKNEKNLGMDGNFERVADLATGEYLWYCGQDDIITEAAAQKALALLEQDKSIDSIFMNFSQNDHFMQNVLVANFLSLEKDRYCQTKEEILAVTGLNSFPSFLPSMIIRKSLWDKTKELRRKFHGTQFVQMGAFIALIPQLKLYVVADPLVKGRIPNNGWQVNKVKLFDILSGDLEVISYFFRNTNIFNKIQYLNHMNERKEWLSREIGLMSFADLGRVFFNKKIVFRMIYLGWILDFYLWILTAIFVKMYRVFSKRKA